jgi:uracil-DNA glycosylase family 4
MMSAHEKAARELLAFYVEAGVDALLGEAPVDRFAGPDVEKISTSNRIVSVPSRHRVDAEIDRISSSPAFPPDRLKTREDFSPSRSPPAATIPPTAPPSSEAAVMAAREAARSAGTLDELRAILNGFEGCALRKTATQLVFADGNPQARLVFIGEAPGREEDIEGLPFVGRSGRLLDLMLKAIGLDRTSAYIANIIPWRPPGNRTPTPQETATCLPFIQRQIELVNPDVLVTLGNPSTQALLGTREGITKTRGRWFKFHTGTREIRAMPTLHPAYLLRQPLSKRLAWRDFLAIKKELAG